MKRYIVTIEMYGFANSDAEMINKTQKLVKKIEKKENCSDVLIQKIELMEFGQMNPKTIYTQK